VQRDSSSLQLPHLDSSPPKPFLSSSPSTPVKPVARKAVIEDSDDGANDSDDSLPDLLNRPAAIPAPTPARGAVEVTTPRAKRTALEFHSSPLTLQPRQQRHRFDMNALLSHAQRDDAANASALRVAAMLEEDDDTRKPKTKARNGASGGLLAENQTSTSLLDKIMDVLPDVDEDDPERRERFLRAVKRTEANATRKRWYFLGDRSKSPPVTRSVFPAKAATGAWKFLTSPETRKVDLQRGLATTIMQRGYILPEEILSWVLDELCVEQDLGLSQAYQAILKGSFDADGFRNEHGGRDRRLLDEEWLRRLFSQIGASDHGLDLSQRVAETEDENAPYSNETDWHALKMVLILLASSGRWMQLESLIYATRMLLRMSLDPLIQRNVDIFRLYVDAIGSLLGAVAPRDWDQFVSGSFFTSFCLRTLTECSAKKLPQRCIGPLPMQLSGGMLWPASRAATPAHKTFGVD
jgi:hypothetical protein